MIGDGKRARARRDALAREGARVALARVIPRRRGPRSRGRRASPGSPAQNPVRILRKMRPALVFSTLEDLEENRSIAQAAHSIGALVHVYDTPSLSDFTMPSVGTAGPIRLAVSTAGRSPAMAALLRRRIERSIRPRDVARVQLMGRLRRPIQATLRSPEARRDLIYRLLRHREIGRLLRAGRSDEALAVARKVIASRARGSPLGLRQAKR